MRSLVVLPLVAGSAAKAAFDIDLATLTRPPLWEPTWEEYFGTSASPVFLTNPSAEDFAQQARKGHPLVVTDWGTGMPFLNWTGRDFAQKFPFGYMKAEYIRDMPGFNVDDHDVKVMDGELRFNLGSFHPDLRTPWHNFSRPASKRYADDPEKPKSGPYVWHVKDEVTAAEKPLVQAYMRSPPFLQGEINKERINSSFEVWFSPGGHAGAGAHNDGYCESVVSLQLRGDKTWRKMLLPEMSLLDSFDEFDGGIYPTGKWKPDLHFVNTQGSAVVWPPGYLHETSTVPPEDGECGTALTFQYTFPQPVKFFRAFLPRLSLSAEVGQCVPHAWTKYVSFGAVRLRPSSKTKEIESQLTEILRLLDVDADEQIMAREVFEWLSRGTAAKLQHEHFQEYCRLEAEDMVAYHDLNDDKVVSRQELWDSLVQWNVVRMRVKKGLALVNKADLAGLEAFERSLDYLRRSPVQFPSHLRAELEHVFHFEKGTKILRSVKGIESYSDSEFWEPLRDALESIDPPPAELEEL